MSYFGHTCELPFMERPMGPCPACEYARDMREIGEAAAKLKEVAKAKSSPAAPSPSPTTPETRCAHSWDVSDPSASVCIRCGTRLTYTPAAPPASPSSEAAGDAIRNPASALDDERLLARVREVVREMCNRDRWRMSIPVNAEDSDMVICELADRYVRFRASTEREARPGEARALDRVLAEVVALIDRNVVSARSPLADALIDYADIRFDGADPIIALRTALDPVRRDVSP